MCKTRKPSGVTQPVPQPPPPRDLVDFYLRWPEFRAIAAHVAKRRCMSHAEREVLTWLVQLADRVGPRDLV
jgi:hypothetical protein